MEDDGTKRMEESENAIIGNTIDSFELHGKTYKVVKVISETSGEAQVYLLNYEGVNTVLKLYYPNFSPKLELLKILSNIHSDRVVRLHSYGFLSQETSTRCYELMEYLEGGSLEEIKINNDEELFTRIAVAAAEALDVCHTQGIIHRDVKLSNFFFRDTQKQELVLGDFGISSLSEEDELHRTTQARTPIYAAPEMYMNVIDGEVELTSKIDYYSLGITLLYLWLGRNPFTGNERLIMQQKSEGKLPGIDQLPPAINKLIRGLTVINPEFRWGFAEVERWKNGENVPISDDIPYLRYKRFLFDPDKELIAKNATDLAALMKGDPKLGARYLYNKRITKWLEESGNHKLSLAIDEIVEKYFPFDQLSGVKAAIYILDSKQPFLLTSPHPSSTPKEIVKAFSHNQNTADEFKSLTDGRLLLWLSNKEEPELYDEIKELTEGQEHSKGLAYGVLYTLDKGCGFDLLKSTAREQVALLMNNVLMANQEVEDQTQYAAALEDFLGGKNKLYYYAKIHGWNDILEYREYCMSLLDERIREERLGEYNLAVAAYKLCASMGCNPAYLLPRKQTLIFSLDDLKNAPEAVVKKEIRSGKMRQWLTIFFHERPGVSFDEEYSYEKTLAAYLAKVEEFNPTDYYVKRFFMATEEQAAKQNRFKTALKSYYAIDITCNAVFLILGFLLIYLLKQYDVSSKDLLLNNYYYVVVAPLLVFGVLFYVIKFFHLSTGFINSILFTLLGIVATVAPAIGARFLIDKLPAQYTNILVATIALYMVVIFVFGLRRSSYKLRYLSDLYEDKVKYTLLEPLYFAYKTTASRYKSSNTKAFNEGFEIVRTAQRRLLTYYLIWITLVVYFIAIFVCYNPAFVGMEVPKITWESIKEALRVRGTNN